MELRVLLVSKTAFAEIPFQSKFYTSPLQCADRVMPVIFAPKLLCVLAKRVLLFSSCLSVMRREYGFTKESAKDMHAQLCACELLVGLPNTRSELSL